MVRPWRNNYAISPRVSGRSDKVESVEQGWAFAKQLGRRLSLEIPTREGEVVWSSHIGFVFAVDTFVCFLV